MRARNRAKIALVSAIGAVTLGPTGAAAHFDWDTYPIVPGVGSANGIVAQGPQIGVAAGRVRVHRRLFAPIVVECRSSTEAGCRGTLELADSAGRSSRVGLDLDEGQAWSVLVPLPQSALRAARNRRGWRATATGSVTDSLGRSGSATARIRVLAR